MHQGPVVLLDYQGKYVYNAVQVILLALIDYIHFSVQTKWLGCCFDGSLVGKVAFLFEEAYGSTFKRPSVFPGKFFPKPVEKSISHRRRISWP